MKKVLLASTMLVGFASMAAADVTLSGSGRMGLVYEDDGTDDDTYLSYRFRLNIDASTETDGGIVFGGRVRLQYDNGDSHVEIDDGALAIGGAAELNAAMLYAESAGFRIEVGNVNTAFDSLATLYNAELGFISSTTGSYSRFDYSSYSSGPYINTPDRVGLFASYSVGSVVARLSYIDYDQFNTLVGVEEEIGISVDYTAGSFKIGAGYVQNATGADDYDVYAVLGEYALSDTTNVGLQFIAENGATDDQTITLYGNTMLGNGIGVGAFVTALDTDDVTVEDDYAVGLGASYDLGGATLAGTIQKGYDDDTYADLGINFSF